MDTQHHPDHHVPTGHRRRALALLAATVSIGALGGAATTQAATDEFGRCGEVAPPADDPTGDSAPADSADSETAWPTRCDIDPFHYIVAYPEFDGETSAQPTSRQAQPTDADGGDTATGVVAEAPAGQPGHHTPPPPPHVPDVPGPLDDNTFVSEGHSTWVETDSDRESTFALDVDTGSYSVAETMINGGVLPAPDSVRPEEWINSFDYGDEPATDDDLAVTVESNFGASGPAGTADDPALVRIGVATREIAPEARPNANITFVIDTSGSMDIRSRLGTVQASLALLVRTLGPDDTISIVTYGSDATPLLEPTPVSEWRSIIDAIDAVEPGGSTNMEAGLEVGYEMAADSFDPDAVNVVVLASDGVANVGVTDADELTDTITQAGEDGIHLITVGYGMGNYNDHLMEQLANQGDGFYSYIDNYGQAIELFVDELVPTLVVVAEEAKVQVVFDPDVVARYRLIGYENRQLDDSEFRDDTVDAGELGAGHQVSALYEVELVGHDAGDSESLEIGEVRLRWASADDSDGISDESDVIETATPIDLADGNPESPSIRLAATVAYSAETIAGNPIVADERNVTLGDLRAEAEGIAELDDLDPAVADGATDLAEFLKIAEHCEPYPDSGEGTATHD